MSKNQTAMPAAVAALCLLVAAHGAGAADAGYTCLIEPFQRVELRSPVEARIHAMHVDRGSEVKKGQILVELDSAAEKVALEAARYRAVMEGQIKTAESKLTGATEKFKRRDQLVAEKFISAQDRDDSLADMRMAEASLVEARDNRRLAAIEEQRLLELLELRRLRSPFDGVVTERLKHVGEMATTGENARPVLRLAQTHPLRVEVVLPVALYGQLKPGQRATVETEPPLSARYQATLTIVDRVVDSASGTFGVRLELPNLNRAIPAGVKCRVTFSR